MLETPDELSANETISKVGGVVKLFDLFLRISLYVPVNVPLTTSLPRSLPEERAFSRLVSAQNATNRHRNLERANQIKGKQESRK